MPRSLPDPETANNPDELVSEWDLFAMLPEAVLYAPISAQAVRLFAVLMRYAGEKRAAWPSRATLADRLHVTSVDTVDRAVRELRDAGFIDVQHRMDDSGQRSNLYRLTRPGRRDAARKRAREREPEEREG